MYEVVEKRSGAAQCAMIIRVSCFPFTILSSVVVIFGHMDPGQVVYLELFLAGNIVYYKKILGAERQQLLKTRSSQ